MRRASRIVLPETCRDASRLVGLRQARRVEFGALGLLLTTTAGTSYALWRGTQLLQALRDAQLDFARHLRFDDPRTYPRFVETVVAGWPARVAAHPPTFDSAVRVALAVAFGFCAFAVLRVRPEGVLLEEVGVGHGLRSRRLAEARRISGFGGRLLMRPAGFDSAISSRDAVYFPRTFCQTLDRFAEEHAAEQAAFVIVHERSHAESLDNALWSIGAVDSLLVTGLLAVLLVPASLPAATILIPDSFVRAVPLGASVGLAATLTALGIATVATATVGLLTSLTAAREYCADAVAAAVVGPDHLPYVESDRGRWTGVRPWLPGCAVAERRLHVRGVFARRGALEALAIATWAAGRAGLALATGAPYGFDVALFDAAFLGWLTFVLASLPRVSAGARGYPVLPLANLFAVVTVISVSLVSIDAFAVGKGLEPLFGPRWPATLVAPPCLVMSALIAWSCRGRGRAHAAPVATLGWGATMAELSLFVASVPSRGVSFVTGGLCAFVVAGVVADALRASAAPTATRVIDLASAAACLPLSLLVARNMRRPTAASAAAEAILTVPIAGAACYLGNVLYEVAAGTTPDEAGAEALRARLAALDPRSFPSPALAVAFAGILAASWLARWRSNARPRPGVRP